MAKTLITNDIIKLFSERREYKTTTEILCSFASTRKQTVTVSEEASQEIANNKRILKNENGDAMFMSSENVLGKNQYARGNVA